jgi:hypothetical protein
VLETRDVESSVKRLLDEIQSASNALLPLADAKPGIGLGLKVGIVKIRRLLTELRDIREARPAEVANLIHQYAAEVDEVYEAVTDVVDLVDAESKPQLIGLALDIHGLLK